MKERIQKESTLIKGVESISRVIFPYKVVEGEEYLNQTKVLLQNNKGVILITNHFSKRDAIQGLQIFEKYFAPHTKRAVMPFAKHQYKPVMGKVLEKLKVEAYPILDHNKAGVLEMARKIPKEQRSFFFAEIEREYANYLNGAQKALNEGGIVGLVAQGTREPRLKKPEALPITKLLERTNINIENVAILCVGIGFAEKTDYSSNDIRGFNPKADFVVKVGKVFSLWKLLKDIDEKHLYPNIDFWIHDQLKTLVPTEYLEK